jgi:tRNA threonylcarbamoyladenosine biosynthesis protein TsaE
MGTFISRSPGDTEALGEQWGRQAQPGWLIGLTGGLGAGKTVLAAGLARGLGVTARVQSPTFVLVNEYPGGRLPLFHVDLYRLATRADIIAAGLEPYLERPAGVAVVEWMERWLEETAWHTAPGVRLRRVEIKMSGETGREIIYEDFGG